MPVLMLLACLTAEPSSFAAGKSEVEITVGDLPLKCFVYRPNSYQDGPLLFVFHGVLRNASEYRDHAVGMGDRFGALVVAPLFDEARFPLAKYQHGGIVRDGMAVPKAERTGAMIPKLAAAIRQREKRSDMPYYMIGHSGGGQFLFRLAAFVDTDAKEIVASNSGTLVFPKREAPFPYGYGKLPDELATDDEMKRFAGQKLTLYIGDKDTERDEYLDVSAEADEQGPYRFARNQAAFKAWKKLADEKGWPFRWRLVVAKGIEHDHEKMFDHAMCKDSLFGRK
jgi:hypothetical protein